MPVRTLPAWPAGRPLRAWQEEAVAAVLAHPQRSFLASATPAAGKTTFGLHVAHRMLSEGRVGRDLHRRADHPHRPPVGRRRRPLRARHRAQPAQRRRAGAARPPRRRGDLPDARRRPEGAPPPLPGGPDAAAGRRAAPHGRPGRLGPQRAGGVRGRALPPAALGHAVPLRQHADPVDRLRRGRRLPRRLRLRLHRRAARRRLPPRRPSTPTTATWSGCPTAAAAAPTSRSACPPPRRRAGCAPRSTPTATGSPTCCATPTRG